MPTFFKVLFARLRFVAVFVVAALFVGYWPNIRNHIDKWIRPPVAPDSLAGKAAREVEYYCPMHPDVVKEEPGTCPKCGMQLDKRARGKAQELPADVLARVQLSPWRVAMANIQTSSIEERALTNEIHAVGVLDYNETLVAQLSARVAGRADKLFIQYMGQSVRKGDGVYLLYSPEVYTAQREYLLARKRVKDLGPDATQDSREDASAVYSAAVQKLVLWGVTNDQLDYIDKEYGDTGQVPTHLTVTSPISGIVVKKDIYPGGYVQAGSTPYTIADLSSLWLQAKIYEHDLPMVAKDAAVDVVVDALPNETFPGKVTFVAYQLDPATRTVDARIEVKNPGLRLRPGMFAEAVIRVPVTNGTLHPATQAAEETMGEPPMPQAATMPATQPGAMLPAEMAGAFRAALEPYLKAHKLLAGGKDEGVSALLHEAIARLAPIAQQPAVAADYRKLEAAVHLTMGQKLADLRQTFRDVSSDMIAIGKTTGVSPGPNVQVFRCPMVKANWLQDTDATANPYDNTMPTCGAPVEPINIVAPDAPATRPMHLVNGKVLAVPRSAVIDTGRRLVVYVEAGPGIYDMREVKLGPVTGEFYPVVEGLSAGERVVSVGAFLVDSENRLNPMPTTRNSEPGTRN